MIRRIIVIPTSLAAVLYALALGIVMMAAAWSAVQVVREVKTLDACTEVWAA